MLMDKNNMIIAEQRANIAREIEYLRVMTESSYVADRFLLLEELSEGYNESVDDMENKDIMAHMDADGDEGKDSEVGRIMDSNSDMSFDEMIGIQQNLGDVYESAFMEDVFFEGVNIDYRRAKKILNKQCKPFVKKMKKAVSDGEYGAAKSYLKRAKKEFDDAKKAFDAADNSLDADSLKTAVIGYFYDGLIQSLKIIGITILTIPVAGLGGTIMGIYSNIEIIVQTIKQAAEDIKKEKFSPKTLNMVRNRTKSAFDSTEKVFDKVETLLNEMEKESKGVKKESMDDNMSSSTNSSSASDSKASADLDKTIKDVEKSNTKDNTSNTTDTSSKDNSLMTEDEIIDEMFSDLYEEGVNKELFDIRRQYIKPAMKKLKTAKQMIKKGNRDSAIKMLEDVIADMEAVKTVVKSMDDTSTEKMIGGMLASWKSLLGMTISVIAMCMGIPANSLGLMGAGYAGLIASAFASEKDLKKAQEGAEKILDGKMKKEGWQKALTESFNAYRTATYQMADEIVILSKKIITDMKDGSIFERIEAERNKK